MADTKTTVVHVNTHVIKRNGVRLKRSMPASALEPPLTAKGKGGGKVVKSNTFELVHKGHVVARVVYRPLTPLKSGATAWIETDCEVVAVPDPAPVVAAPPQSSPDLTALLLKLLVERHGPEIRQLLDEGTPK